MRDLQKHKALKTIQDSTDLGKIIREHRKISGLSRIECARLAGIGKTVVFDIEHGKASVQLDTVLKLLRVLNISLTLTGPLLPNSSNPIQHTRQ